MDRSGTCAQRGVIARNSLIGLCAERSRKERSWIDLLPKVGELRPRIASREYAQSTCQRVPGNSIWRYNSSQATPNQDML